MIRHGIAVLTFALLSLAGSRALSAQQLRPASLPAAWTVGDQSPRGPALASVPDSVRQRVGYQHWKGAAIGGGLGALGGLALALAAHGRCYDCPADSPNVGQVTLIGAGLGGALGFLAGLATPRYRWVPALAE